MILSVRAYTDADIQPMMRIWNQIVAQGIAFPQEEELTPASAAEFFAAQTHCGVAELVGEVVGLYILHPNNVGRCGHICNASYAVAENRRGMGIGELLVRDCITQGHNYGFKILQFNAVVKTNLAARHLYEKLGFIPLGVIKNGFRLKNGEYEDICPYWREI